MKQTTIILSALILMSCSARKVDKSQLTEKAKVTETESVTTNETTLKESEANVRETTTTVIDTDKNVITEVTEIVPIDETKDANFTDAKGQTYNLKNSKYRNEKTTDLSNEKTVSISEYEKLLKEAETGKKEAKSLRDKVSELQRQLDIKNTSAFRISLWWLLLLLIPIGWYGWKRFRLF